MIHQETHRVTPENGPRPAGKPDECFYCRSSIGDNHKPDCVLRRRTVVVKMTLEYTIAVPEFWDSQAINFHRNDSSWCANNALKELEYVMSDERESCVCGRCEFEYVREATEDDDRECGLDRDIGERRPPPSPSR